MTPSPSLSVSDSIHKIDNGFVAVPGPPGCVALTVVVSAQVWLLATECRGLLRQTRWLPRWWQYPVRH